MFTELVETAIANTQAHDELAQLAQEQAALRRVATLVAQGATPDLVFDAVRHEVARMFDVPLSVLARYNGAGTATLLATSDGYLGYARSPFPPIAHYGFLSDCEACALVAPSGSVPYVVISPTEFAFASCARGTRFGTLASFAGVHSSDRHSMQKDSVKIIQSLGRNGIVAYSMMGLLNTFFAQQLGVTHAESQKMAAQCSDGHLESCSNLRLARRTCTTAKEWL